jgi:hypothetical protein
MTSASTYPVQSAVQNQADVQLSCECSREEHEQNHFFRGILVAVPAGLVLWIGILKVAALVLSRY